MLTAKSRPGGSRRLVDDMDAEGSQRFKISASAIGTHFRYECDRALRLSCISKEERAQYRGFKTKAQSAMMDTLTTRGHRFEADLISRLQAHPALSLLSLNIQPHRAVMTQLTTASLHDTVLYQTSFTMHLSSVKRDGSDR